MPSNIRTSKGNEYFLARKSLQHFLECVPSSSVVRKVLSLLHVSVLQAEDPKAATSAAPTGQGSRDDTGAANAKQCADSATRCGLSTRLNLSPVTGLLPPREPRSGGLGRKGPTVLQESGKQEQPQRGPAK